MADLNQFGSLSEFRIGPISTDRFGVLSAQVFVERQEDATDFDLSFFLPGNEPKFIVPCQGRQRSYKGGIATYTFSYEGGALTADFAERIFFDLEGSDSEEPIETHPNWMANAEKYNAQFDRAGQFSYFARKLEDGKENPVYGATQYLSIGMVWTCTLIVRELPGNECELLAIEQRTPNPAWARGAGRHLPAWW
ncbi:MAG: hypothetical protein V4710_16510 [Verrucomicrobiota bacterium]